MATSDVQGTRVTGKVDKSGNGTINGYPQREERATSMWWGRSRRIRRRSAHLS
jgi:hypothetical protein